MNRLGRLILPLVLLMLAGCTPNSATGSGTANPAEDLHLHDAVLVELYQFQNDAGTYALAGVIDEADEIARFVALFDTSMPLGPVPTCVHDLQIRFGFASEQTVELGYGCEGEATFLVGGPTLEQGFAMTPPADLTEALGAWMDEQRQ